MKVASILFSRAGATATPWQWWWSKGDTLERTTVLRNWIFEENLKPTLEIIARYAGYDFSPDDWNAVRFGVAESDEERNRWYDYEFSGTGRVLLRFAQPTGSTVICVQIESTPDMETRIETVLAIAQHYRIADRK